MRLLKFLVIIVIATSSCVETNVNLNAKGEDKFEAKEIDDIPLNAVYSDTTYVSVYSDIYSETKDIRFNLTATLSLRNTSLRHSIYISSVDYYGSSGERENQYLTKPIELEPLQTVEYVVEEIDSLGGTGANFIITWSSENSKVDPLFESIMISTQGQQGISFTSRGVSISERTNKNEVSDREEN